MSNPEEKNRIEKGTLYVVSTPIGNLADISQRAVKVLSEVDFVAAEDTRNSGKMLHFLGISKPFVSYFEHNKAEKGPQIAERLKNGESCALVTDAGTPAVSDPGADLVKLCIEENISVTAVPGCCAAVNALVLSGLDTRRFLFEGFLEGNDASRRRTLEELSSVKRTMIFYEAPHRIKKTLEDLYEVFGDRKACVARELTKKHEEFIRAGLKALSEIDPETLKGEMVIVVEGSNGEEKPIIGDNDLINMVKTMVESGMSTKDAIKKVSELTKINKNTIYKIYHLN